MLSYKNWKMINENLNRTLGVSQVQSLGLVSPIHTEEKKAEEPAEQKNCKYCGKMSKKTMKKEEFDEEDDVEEKEEGEEEGDEEEGDEEETSPPQINVTGSRLPCGVAPADRTCSKADTCRLWPSETASMLGNAEKDPINVSAPRGNTITLALG